MSLKPDLNLEVPISSLIKCPIQKEMRDGVSATAAINLDRILAWFDDVPGETTRTSRFAALVPSRLRRQYRSFVFAIIFLALTSLACNLSSATTATAPVVETPEFANIPSVTPIPSPAKFGAAATVTLVPSPSAAIATPLPITIEPDISPGVTPAATQTPSLHTSCPHRWFFPGGPDTCPAEAPLYSEAAEQHFENGAMVWIAAEDRIYVLYYDDSLPKWIVFTDEWAEGQPEFDPSLVPPDGLRQPVRGFGLIWRELPGLRQRLGWAIDREAGYATAVQRSSQANGYDLYLQAIDGKIMLLLPGGIGWEKLSG